MSRDKRIEQEDLGVPTRVNSAGGSWYFNLGISEYKEIITKRDFALCQTTNWQTMKTIKT